MRPFNFVNKLFYESQSTAQRKDFVCTLSQIFISFALSVSLYCKEHVYIHIPNCTEIVYELPLLPDNTVSETLFHKSGSL
jgi:hypothetical protein